MSTPDQTRGILWMIAAVLLCPCHLPLTLWLLGAALSGTAAGVLLNDHPVVSGVVIVAAFLAAVWRGLRSFKAAESCDRQGLERGALGDCNRVLGFVGAGYRKRTTR